MFVVMEAIEDSYFRESVIAQYKIISPDEGFDSYDDARKWCNEQDLCDVAIFEFKGFV